MKPLKHLLPLLLLILLVLGCKKEEGREVTYTVSCYKCFVSYIDAGGDYGGYLHLKGEMFTGPTDTIYQEKEWSYNFSASEAQKLRLFVMVDSSGRDTTRAMMKVDGSVVRAEQLTHIGTIELDYQ
jgi:hypothetical protein